MDFNEYIKQAKDMGVDEDDLKDLMSDFVDEIEELKMEAKEKKDAGTKAKEDPKLIASRHEAATAFFNYFSVAYPEIAAELSVKEIEDLFKEEEHATKQALNFVDILGNIFKDDEDDSEGKDNADDVIAKFLKRF